MASDAVTGARLEGDASQRRVRLYFAPNPKVRTADWEGEALMDSSTSLADTPLPDDGPAATTRETRLAEPGAALLHQRL